MSDNPARCQTLGTDPSFGFGDRIGLATPGHVLAMQRCGRGILPIYPQQSIREMVRTNRSPDDVMNDALAGMRDAGWDGPTGADADPEATCYLGPGAELYFDVTCIHPNDAGHHAMFEMFRDVIQE